MLNRHSKADSDTSILNTDAGEILIYDVIVESNPWDYGITPKQVKAAFDELKDRDVVMRFDSPGGSVFAAAAMYAVAQEHNGNIQVKIDGACFSAASFLAMVGDGISMSASSMLMIHDPWTFASGNAGEMRKTADLLDQIRDQIVGAYDARTDLGEETLAAMMAEETWLTPELAKEKGFVDEVIEHKAKAGNRYDLSKYLARFKNAPKDWPLPQKTPRFDALSERLRSINL